MTSSKQRALQALLTCTNRKEVAKKAGISERTLRGYLHDPSFTAELNRLYDGWMEECTRELQLSVKLAVQTLRETLTDVNASVPMKVASAKAILDTAPKYLETNNIIQRINELEKNVNGGM